MPGNAPSGRSGTKKRNLLSAMRMQRSPRAGEAADTSHACHSHRSSGATGVVSEAREPAHRLLLSPFDLSCHFWLCLFCSAGSLSLQTLASGLRPKAAGP